MAERDPRVKSLCWGFDEDKTCLYCVGHIDAAKFLQIAEPIAKREIGATFAALGVTTERVKHGWFRRYSPSEARSRGWDSGYEECEVPTKRGRGMPFPVTRVIV